MNPFTLENTKTLIDLLEYTKGVEQDPKHHPEGDVFVHSLQTLQIAFRETNDVDLILAAMLHDIGKRIDKKEHDKWGTKMLTDLVSVKTLFLVENHMRIKYYTDGRMKKLSKCQLLINHPWFLELIQLMRFDLLGRNPNKKMDYNKEKIIEKLNKCANDHFYLPEYLQEENYTRI